MTTKQSISKDALGDRMKMYEKAEAGRRFMPGIPIVARIDGRAFHSFTKGLERPYDTALHECMKRTCIALVDKTDANCGYTQSDEITLTWLPSNPETQIWFGGRIAKMTSQLAALATVYFNKYVQELLPEDYANKLPTFDARVWQVPSADEGANTFLWREWDATKNSISMAAHAHFSHKSLHGLSGRDKVDRLLNEKGINWNDFPVWFKRGTYVQRRKEERTLSIGELAQLPEKHAARNDPNFVYSRSVVKEVEMPVFSKVTNRAGVIYKGEDPIVAK